ncbi:hypothetical protein [Streptomyces sp. NPDC005283]|uniref:hypothetical protein n=1 Tax=Streptomyces sp. NPDC005283 TaxID=3156871 RepID=UPI0034525035
MRDSRSRRRLTLLTGQPDDGEAYGSGGLEDSGLADVQVLQRRAAASTDAVDDDAGEPGGGMVQLSREQARGRARDFEIIEYILRGQPGGVPGTWGHHFDDCLLHAPLTDQHRNKIAHQAALIESALGSDPADVPSTAPPRAPPAAASC